MTRRMEILLRQQKDQPPLAEDVDWLLQETNHLEAELQWARQQRDDLRRELEEAREQLVQIEESSFSEGYEVGFEAGYSSGHEDSYNEDWETGYAQGLADGSDIDKKLLDCTRQARLTELLEAEARERVEVIPGRGGVVEIRPRGEDKSFVSVAIIGDAPIDFRVRTHGGDTQTLETLLYCLAAALAEKRKREQASLELPSPNLTPDENGEICCPSCGRMVGERDFGRADICKACERGLT